ncbi:MAG: hypothetical protein LJF30_00970 [Acidobacteria bacterium]|nr:hypothetical protein [Acidobacteriota bacterium]
MNGAYCVPGMLGCILHGKVVFPDGKERRPRWPDGARGPTPRRTPDETSGGD